jgi:hypothetical protein
VTPPPAEDIKIPLLHFVQNYLPKSDVLFCNVYEIPWIYFERVSPALNSNSYKTEKLKPLKDFSFNFFSNLLVKNDNQEI